MSRNWLELRTNRPVFIYIKNGLTQATIQIAFRLEEETGLELQDKVLPELGFCNKTNTWGPGIFAEGTEGQNREVIIYHLKESGLTQQKAQKVTNVTH